MGTIHRSAWVAPTAVVTGDVTLGGCACAARRAQWRSRVHSARRECRGHGERVVAWPGVASLDSGPLRSCRAAHAPESQARLCGSRAAGYPHLPVINVARSRCTPANRPGYPGPHALLFEGPGRAVATQRAQPSRQHNGFVAEMGSYIEPGRRAESSWPGITHKETCGLRGDT
jgi:hypothetical protein